MTQSSPGSCLTILLFLIVGALLVLALTLQQGNEGTTRLMMTATGIAAQNIQIETAIAATMTAQANRVTATP